MVEPILFLSLQANRSRFIKFYVMIKRTVAKVIRNDYKRKKVIVLLGARQVGKSTLLSELSSKNDRQDSFLELR